TLKRRFSLCLCAFVSLCCPAIRHSTSEMLFGIALALGRTSLLCGPEKFSPEYAARPVLGGSLAKRLVWWTDRRKHHQRQTVMRPFSCGHPLNALKIAL